MSYSSFSELESLNGPDTKYFKSKYTKREPVMSNLSRNSSSMSTHSGRESKYYKMKKLVMEIKEYLQNGTETSATLVSRYLQALSVTIDLSIFDPHTNIASEFFVSLYELMSNIEIRSAFAWHCVDVLSNVCRNSAARYALIHTYQFLPSLSRILTDQITKEKKIRLLKVIQDLSCGVKISWQIPHLPHLIKTLAKWVENQDEQISSLSLGVLVNLCYKNLSAIYTLTSNVDMKKLMKTCLVLKGPILEAHACKLLMICDQNQYPLATSLEKLVTITFTSMKKAFENRDHILLRQLVEFYMDIEKQKRNNENENLSEIYENETLSLIKLLDKTMLIADSTKELQGTDTYNLDECISLIFQFIHHLIEINLNCLKKFYPKFVEISLKWIQSDVVSPHSIAILKTISINTTENDIDSLRPIGINLPIFMMMLDSGTHEEFLTHSEHNKKISALLQLLKVLMKVDYLKNKFINEIKEETMYKVFYPLLDDSPRLNDINTSSEESVNLYIHAIGLVDELAKYDANWATIRANLFQQRQIHYVLSQGLYSGSKEIKNLILEMATLSEFPKNNVATAMSSIQSLVHINSIPPVKNHFVINGVTTPLLSITQVEELDILINRLKEAVTERNFEDISTSDVMELYEYKLATMGHAERAATASVEAASERCTHLQHRTAQLSAEMNRIQQLLFHTQQRSEELIKTKQQLEEVIQQRTNSYEAERGRHKVIQNKLNQEEKKTIKLQEDYDELNKKLQETNEIKNQLEEQLTKLKHLTSKLEENCSRLEKNLMKKDDSLKSSMKQNEELKMQITSLEQQLNRQQEILNAKNEELIEALEDLKIKQQLLDTITKVAQQHNKK